MLTRSTLRLAAFGAMGALAATGWMRGRAQQPAPDIPNLNYLYTDRDAVVLGPPELAAPPQVQGAAWSPNSRYVCALSALPPAPDASGAGTLMVSLWSASAHRAEILWTKALEGGLQGPVGWLPDTSVALLPLQWQTTERVPGENGTPVQTRVAHNGLL